MCSVCLRCARGLELEDFYNRFNEMVAMCDPPLVRPDTLRFPLPAILCRSTAQAR